MAAARPGRVLSLSGGSGGELRVRTPAPGALAGSLPDDDPESVELFDGAVARRVWLVERRLDAAGAAMASLQAANLCDEWTLWDCARDAPKLGVEGQVQRCPYVWIDNLCFLTDESGGASEPALLFGVWEKTADTYGRKRAIRGLALAGGGHFERCGRTGPPFRKPSFEGDLSLVAAADRRLWEETRLARAACRRTVPLGLIDDVFNDPRAHGVRFAFLRHVCVGGPSAADAPQATPELRELVAVPVSRLPAVCAPGASVEVAGGEQLQIVLNHNVFVLRVLALPTTQAFLRAIGGGPAAPPAQVDAAAAAAADPGFARWLIRSAELHMKKEAPAVGEGAFGTVHQAVYRGSEVVVKSLKRPHAHAIAEHLEEARRLSLLRPHPALCLFLGLVLDHADGPALVLEFVHRGSLEKFAEEVELSELDVLSMAKDVASGMLHLHEQRILHCDLAARNMLVVAQNPCRVKITDFGLSRALPADGTSVSVRGHPFAVRWSPPEVLREESREFFRESDVWAFGMTLFEVTARAAPFAELESNDAVIAAVLAGEWPSPLPAGMSHVSDLMLESWEPEPLARPTFLQVVARVSRWLSALQQPAQRPPSNEQVDDADDAGYVYTSVPVD